MKIQIIGTKVIPEFGVMIQFSLIIAIIAAIEALKINAI